MIKTLLPQIDKPHPVTTAVFPRIIAEYLGLPVRKFIFAPNSVPNPAGYVPALWKEVSRFLPHIAGLDQATEVVLGSIKETTQATDISDELANALIELSISRAKQIALITGALDLNPDFVHAPEKDHRDWLRLVRLLGQARILTGIQEGMEGMALAIFGDTEWKPYRCVVVDEDKLREHVGNEITYHHVLNIVTAAMVFDGDASNFMNALKKIGAPQGHRKRP